MAQGDQLEYQVKAAYLFNFARFVEWPKEASAGPFTICLADDPFGQSLENTLRGETISERPLTVRLLAASDNPRECHILFISDTATARTQNLLDALGTAPVLTVGEDRSFIANGGIIRFTETGRRVQFEINPDAADRRSLKISSRLLRLATIVRPRETGIRQ